jgi:hypothetical protein
VPAVKLFQVLVVPEPLEIVKTGGHVDECLQNSLLMYAIRPGVCRASFPGTMVLLIGKKKKPPNYTTSGAVPQVRLLKQAPGTGKGVLPATVPRKG